MLFDSTITWNKQEWKIDEIASKLLADKGFTNKNWLTKFFQGNDHSEKSWSGRLGVPLEFLLNK